ncbi:MAG: sigma-70 family RNA polymerase sigma factor [Planctomycetota bacterium]|nr:sigma-70 family RNA polymerase sigma factor [Planctomycetota bacterium]
MSDSPPFLSTLERAKQGDRDALAALTERFYPVVEALVHQRLASDMRHSRPWLAARFSTGDVVHLVFEGVLADPGAFAGKTEEAFIGYLATVVRNRILDALRYHQAAQRDGRRNLSLAADFEAEGGEADPANEAIDSEELERLLTAIAAFEPRVQHLLRARIEGLASFRELADQLGYGSESAARRAFFDAQAKLALRLRGDD